MVYLLMLSLAWSAGEKVSVTEARKTWKAFRACENQKAKEADLLRCANAELSEKLIPAVKAQMIQFLDQGISFSDVRECEENAPIQPMKPVAGETAFCMQLTGLKKQSHGYVVFVKENGAAKIQTIKFKF
ncbi:hypothetical protein [Bdellovibrio bacteriovorus]|uniref:Uncharacterized protein n=1 Tax=Bdellovibrio bacteriovorus str. Tiberius TaxID=1069642 RepID=K7YVK5_BDEBC|nr:hypothetical protein [Bdellovibrio bacteriovorus]AFY00725.1 hypothetical protein Bdt_1025 [Bdellovibrio bacteriovorus str. Tiberius]